VRRGGAGLTTTCALSTFTLQRHEQQTDVVARLALVRQLAEHLDTGDRVLVVVRLDTTISTSSFTLMTPRSTRP